MNYTISEITRKIFFGPLASCTTLTLYRQRFSLRKTHFLPLKRFLKCYDAKCH